MTRVLGLRGVVYLRLSSWGRSSDPLSFKQRWEGKERDLGIPGPNIPGQGNSSSVWAAKTWAWNQGGIQEPNPQGPVGHGKRGNVGRFEVCFIWTTLAALWEQCREAAGEAGGPTRGLLP